MENTSEVRTASPSRVTLAGIPERVSRFLRAIAHNAPIRSALATEGYGEVDHQEGWDLFHQVNGYRPTPSPVIDPRSALAMAELDRLDGPLIDKLDATLGHRFPRQREAVLGGLAAGERAVAVANVKSILARVSALEASADAQDQAAAARLAKVRFDGAERERLESLVRDAEHFDATSGAGFDSEEGRWARVAPDHVALWRWFDEWSRAAHRAVGRRDWLIALGLAKRKRKGKDDPEDPPAES